MDSRCTATTSPDFLPMFEIVVQHHFCAAHALRGYDGKCANLHGHNFVVEARVTGDRLNGIGILVDFKDVKAALTPSSTGSIIKPSMPAGLPHHQPLQRKSR